MQFRTRSRDVLMYTCTHVLCVCVMCTIICLSVYLSVCECRNVTRKRLTVN